MTMYQEVGMLIKDRREKRGVTQDELARSIGLTRTSVTNIERGRQKMLLHTFMDIALALDVPPVVLMPFPRANRKFKETLRML